MESVTFYTIVSRGGILMIPIGLCSIIVVAVALERYFTYRKNTIDLSKFMHGILHPIAGGDYLAAIGECDAARGPVPAVIRAGLGKVRYGRERIKEAMENAGNVQAYILEKNLGVLATLAGVAPLLGFLGTVTGMIKAFMKIQQLSGNVNADVLAGGIWEAMVTTAAGLAVGIPAMLLYNYYVQRVRGFVFNMQTASEEVMDMLGAGEELDQPRNRPKNPSHTVPHEGRVQIADADTFDPRDKNFGRGFSS
jgi:biopolymer transport protein ExbB